MTTLEECGRYLEKMIVAHVSGSAIPPFENPEMLTALNVALGAIRERERGIQAIELLRRVVSGYFAIDTGEIPYGLITDIETFLTKIKAEEKARRKKG